MTRHFLACCSKVEFSKNNNKEISQSNIIIIIIIIIIGTSASSPLHTLGSSHFEAVHSKHSLMVGPGAHSSLGSPPPPGDPTLV